MTDVRINASARVYNVAEPSLVRTLNSIVIEASTHDHYVGVVHWLGTGLPNRQTQVARRFDSALPLQFACSFVGGNESSACSVVEPNRSSAFGECAVELEIKRKVSFLGS